MPKRKICNKCGYINSIDDSNCLNCNNDLSLINDTYVNKKEKRHFYNEITHEFSDNPPYESKKKKPTNEIKAKEEIKEIDNDKDELSNHSNQVDDALNNENKVKICPRCKGENATSANECIFCGAYINRVLPSVKEEVKQEEDNSVDDSVVEDELFEFEEEEPKEITYSLVFGIDGENQVKVEFTNNRFIIGRDHQECLEQYNYISRNHCYIKKINEDTFALFESASRPSTNGTFLRTVGERKIRIEPGKGYRLQNGSVFYIGKLIVVFRQDL